MKRTHKNIVLALLFILALPFSSSAQAKPGVLVFNYGEELFEVADFQRQHSVEGNPRTTLIKIGYKCSHLGFFWADAYTWDCHMVEVAGDTSYRALPEEIKSRLDSDPLYGFNKTKRSFWNHYAFWVFVTFLFFWLYQKQKKFNAAEIERRELAKAKRWQEARIRQEQRKKLVIPPESPESPQTE